VSRAVLADAGPLYAAVDPSDQYHERARAEVQRLEQAGYAVLVAFPTLLETYTLVLHRLGGGVARRFLAEVLDGATAVNPDSEDYHAAVKLLGGYPDQRITLFDALVAILARRLDAPIWTYDLDFDVLRSHVWR
jgi:predicted nucleic acid-binding protein